MNALLSVVERVAVAARCIAAPQNRIVNEHEDKQVTTVSSAPRSVGPRYGDRCKADAPASDPIRHTWAPVSMWAEMSRRNVAVAAEPKFTGDVCPRQVHAHEPVDALDVYASEPFQEQP